MNYDITFCSRNCGNKNCERNFNYVNKIELMITKPYVSIAEFNDCEEFVEEK